ncbi:MULTISPECIES: GIY-YIG nuclease family protein [Vagococcus]|uniref:Endonuclease n=1 Tax=Vagococcus teuberi TaxID=519472 RepID=A0A1J0A836_9ENTE|nr:MULTISPECIES: GIY-YIG nuclease family protein [Vagococcus]APB32083.1 endonuclease [Vagococcus teuberi]RHH70226.1 GIY-YIG nuclease family protein [Vagococcus sp. AM17-17]
MAQVKHHYFYVLLCADNTFYAGYTTNLERRLAEHNSGKGAKYTRLKKRRPAKMIHHEVFETKSEAMQKEYAFKQLTRLKKETYLADN